MGHFILDPLRKCRIHFSEECSVVVVAECRQPKKVDKESHRFVAVFHDERVEFCLSICEGIIWAKVDEEFLDE